MKAVQKNTTVEKNSITVFSPDKKGGIRVINVAGTGMNQKDAVRMFGGKLI